MVVFALKFGSVVKVVSAEFVVHVTKATVPNDFQAFGRHLGRLGRTGSLGTAYATRVDDAGLSVRRACREESICKFLVPAG